MEFQVKCMTTDEWVKVEKIYPDSININLARAEFMNPEMVVVDLDPIIAEGIRAAKDAIDSGQRTKNGASSSGVKLAYPRHRFLTRPFPLLRRHDTQEAGRVAVATEPMDDFCQRGHGQLESGLLRARTKVLIVSAIIRKGLIELPNSIDNATRQVDADKWDVGGTFDAPPWKTGRCPCQFVVDSIPDDLGR